MKKLTAVLVAAALCFLSVGCASMKESAYYGKMAKQHDFSYYFSGRDTEKTFASLDAAYDYLTEATAKLEDTSRVLTRAQGLGARLKGPDMSVHANQVFVILCIDASDDSNNAIDTSRMNGPALEKCIREKAHAVMFEILMFYNHKAAIFSNWYLDKNIYGGFEGSNSQVPFVTINGKKYAADYPVGWGLKQCFEYLRGDEDKQGK
jgi:hypothetical protein